MATVSGAVAPADQGGTARFERMRLGRRHPVAGFVVGRVAAGVATLLVVTAMIFAATNVLPGNVADAVLGRNATPARVAALNAKLDLDRPIAARYVSWLGGMVHGDFGNSAVATAEDSPDAAISSSIGAPLKNSLTLAVITSLLLIPLTLLFGALAGIHARRKVDHAISTPALVLGGLPEFVTATLLIVVFFTELHLLPPVSNLAPGEAPLSHIKLLVLPVLTLLVVALGAGVRQVRAGMIDVMDQDYFHVAQLNGLRGRRLLYRYALRNALAPAVQSIAQNIQYLVGGIIIVESVFSYPGIGTYLVQAVSTRDVTQVQAAALILAAIYVAINIVADLVVVFLVPKLRTDLS